MFTLTLKAEDSYRHTFCTHCNGVSDAEGIMQVSTNKQTFIKLKIGTNKERNYNFKHNINDLIRYGVNITTL